MQIDVYTMVRNEKDMLPYFLRHYETIATRIFVWDDGSDDGTLEMLQAHPKVTLLPFDYTGVNDEYQAEHQWPQYKNYSRESNTDWVIQVDCDEFVYHHDLVTRLAYLKYNGYHVVMPTGFLMCSEVFPTTVGQIYEEVKYGVRDRTMDKGVIFRPEIDIKFKPGRHRVLSAKFGDKDAVKCHHSKILYLHFRYFGMEYYYQRINRNCYAHFRTGSPYAQTIYPFDQNRPLMLPDRKMGLFKDWYPKNKDKLVRVIP